MALTEFPTFVEGRHRGGFLVSEARGFRSRDLATLTNSGTAAVTVPAGTVMAITTAQAGVTPAVVATYSSAITAGTAAAILFEPVLIAAGATMKVTIVCRDAEVNAAELLYDATITTTAQQNVLLTQMRTTNLIAR